MHGPEIVVARRLIATPDALDRGSFPPQAVVMRFATDDALVIGEGEIRLDDTHAIIEEERGFAALVLTPEEAVRLFERHLLWQLPPERPAVAQGALAGIPTRIWLEEDRVTVLVATPFVHELLERIV